MTEYLMHPSPPSQDFDFDTARVTKRFKYYTELGLPCQYINMFDEDEFKTSSESGESSDESISSLDNLTQKTSSLPLASLAQKVKNEMLSDSEDTSNISRQKSPKPKKRPVVAYSDSDDSVKSVKSSRPKTQNKYRHRKHSDNSDEDRHRSYQKEKSKPIKREQFEERELKYTPGLTTAAFGNYHCQVCNIVVNSEVTYQTHLLGKKHQKALKAKAVPDVAALSLSESRLPLRVAPSIVSAPSAPIRKTKQIRLNVESLIQRVAEDYKDGPLPGLSQVVEIRPPIEGVRDVSYNCELCEAQCVPISIMKHLTGFKHYLRYLEKIDPVLYERYRYIPKKQIEGKVKRILLDHEKRHGRGKIRVEKEVHEEYSRRDEPGPSWREDRPLPPPTTFSNEDDECQFVSASEHLDKSMSDFYCRACDAHMNNQAMWESHVRGKRHLKNIKKVPGESTSKMKSFCCTGETANLMKMLRDLHDKDEYGNDIVIVGLGYIKETQGEGGDLYNCYLCGACTSSFDIIDHFNQVKHKTRYLEEMNAKGYPNSIEQIKAFSGFSAYSKECMINDECRKSVEQYGEGKVAVYKSKNIL